MIIDPSIILVKFTYFPSGVETRKDKLKEIKYRKKPRSLSPLLTNLAPADGTSPRLKGVKKKMPKVKKPRKAKGNDA